jgi:hypothetical protein
MTVRKVYAHDDTNASGATFSRCERYRYSLWRRWDASKPSVLFLMLNPSTADAANDDATIRRCVGFARRWDAGGIRVCNLYAFRATYPRELKGASLWAVDAPWEGGSCDRAIIAAASDAGRIIAAWGAWVGPYPTRAMQVMDLLAGREVEALALTKDQRPRHPVRLGYAVEPLVYRPARAAA